MDRTGKPKVWKTNCVSSYRCRAKWGHLKGVNHLHLEIKKPGLESGDGVARFYLTLSVLKVVLQKPTPLQIRQLLLYYYLYKERADGCVWELTFAKRLNFVFV
jgi:hypothetical protein